MSKKESNRPPSGAERFVPPQPTQPPARQPRCWGTRDSNTLYLSRDGFCRCQAYCLRSC